jgi:hypothetical protein
MVDAKMGKVTPRYFNNSSLRSLAKQILARWRRGANLSHHGLTITLCINHVTAAALLWVLLLSRALFGRAGREYLVSDGFGGVVPCERIAFNDYHRPYTCDE